MRPLTRICLLGAILLGVLFLTGCTVQPVHVVDMLIPVIEGILPIIATAGSMVDPPAAAAISAGVNLITAGLNALKKSLDQYQADPNDTTLGKVQAAFADVQTNLQALLAAAAIKNPGLQGKITAIITGVVQSLAVIESAIHANHPKVVAAAQATQAGG
jgi:hypothetical protein